MVTVRGRASQTQSGEIATGLRTLALGHRILHSEHHADMTLGHLSWRDPFGRGIWLKRAQIGLDEVTETDFMLLDFDGAVIAGEGELHLEWPIHTELMKHRPEIHAVAHTHPKHATLFSCTESVLRPLTNEGVWFDIPPGRFVATSDLIDTVALGAGHAEAMGEADAVFLRNHGVSFVGRSIQELCLVGIFLEKACRAQLTLAQSGLSFAWPSCGEVRRKKANIYTPNAIANFWDYYVRKVTDKPEARP